MVNSTCFWAEPAHGDWGIPNRETVPATVPAESRTTIPSNKSPLFQLAMSAYLSLGFDYDANNSTWFIGFPVTCSNLLGLVQSFVNPVERVRRCPERKDSHISG